jgi:uncharacterized repeat protein (TIGR01451 family)
MQGATTTVLCPKLQVTKVPGSSSVSANDPIGFAITVSNGGVGVANNVTLIDKVPTDPGLAWSISGLSPSGCKLSMNVLTCHLGNMNPGGSTSINLASGTSRDTCGDVDNTASATTTNGAAAQSSAGVTVNCPDLMVTKTAASNPVNAGQNAVFNITVNNLGPGVARAATLSDALPTGVSWSEDSAACKIFGGLMSCNFGDLASGQMQTVHVTGTTPARLCGPLKNTATVGAANEDRDDLARTGISTATINLNCQADLSIVKQPQASKVSKGSSLLYLITVHNAGPYPAQGLVMSDPLPMGTVFTSLAAGGACIKPPVVPRKLLAVSFPLSR